MLLLTPDKMIVWPSPLCLVTFLAAFCLLHVSFALSVADRSQLARSRLHEALLSPSGKLTLSPELIVSDSTDPTAILLQNSIIQTISTNLRNAKANAAFLQGSVNAVQTFIAEQETARGNFPGPLPVIYCTEDNVCSGEDLRQLSEAGAAGLLVSMQTDNLDFQEDCRQSLELCRQALECGLQPIPEVIVSEETARSWTQDDVMSLAEKLTASLEMEPASILLTIEASSPEESDEEQHQVTLPPVSKQLSKKIPMLGSVSISAGENRIGSEIARFKNAGFSGSLIRADCVPISQQAPLEKVGRFWASCISDLKSTRSKSFSIRVKNKMEKSAMTNWLNYSKDVVDSGALGDEELDASEIDTESGDFKGF